MGESSEQKGRVGKYGVVNIKGNARCIGRDVFFSGDTRQLRPQIVFQKDTKHGLL